MNVVWHGSCLYRIEARESGSFPIREVHAMIDWILIGTLLAIVGLHWLFELIPGRARGMWCSELSLEPAALDRSAPAPHRR
ncbi:hypothetical protein [Fundidesulfovibrio terrae]|uniref:hypothetical protein n=1 Tax=Fundidesulfovibrio terrae TaxID=2922866 RepID=UPI001FB03D5A|nr:hypothetical protein [Fundidesulfovibrio terrae]